MKYTLLLLLVVLSLSVFSQPVSQRSSSSTTAADSRLMANLNLFIPRYVDTTAANQNLGVDTCGSLIFTYVGNKIWKRSCNPKQWDEVGVSESIDTTTRFGGLQTIYQSYLDSLVLAAATNKNTDSLSVHNIRIGANTINIAANTTAIAGKTDTSKTNSDSLVLATAINAKPTFGDVRDIVSDNKLTIRNSTSSTVHTPKRLVFNNSTGISYTGSDTALVALGSSFKTWKVVGQNSLVAVGDDSLSVLKNWGIKLETDTTTTDKKLTISIDSTQVPFIDTASNNLFNLKAATIGSYLDNGGNLSYSIAFGVFGESDFIPVTAGVSYTISNDKQSNFAARFTTYYNSARQFVSGGSSSSVSTFTVPSGVAFVRFAFPVNVNNNTLFFKKTSDLGTGFTDYKGNKIQDYAKINATNATFIKNGANLFNKADATDFVYMTNTGSIVSSTVYGISGFIPVTPGIVYVATQGITNNPMRYSCFFAADGKTVVAGGNSNGANNITAPAGAAFIRVTYIITTDNNIVIDKNNFMFQVGLNSSTYEQFKYGLETDATSYQDSTDLPIWGISRLGKLAKWVKDRNTNYSLVLFGDSYIDGNYYAKKIQDNTVQMGYNYGGTGFCNFGNGDNILNSGSLNNSLVIGSWSTGAWTTNGSTSWGIAGNDEVSTANGSQITITVNEYYDSLKVIYKKQPSGAGFRWRINAGSWTTVSTSNTPAVAAFENINTSGAGSSYTVTLEALGSGVSICGAVPILNASSNYQLRMHKAGFTGSQAKQFANDSLFKQAVNSLSPNGAILTWTTNEQNGDIRPSEMKFNIQKIVNYIRSIDSTIDLLFVAPPQTKYEVRRYKANDYNKVLFQLANENNGAFINFNKVFKPFTQYSIVSGLMAADSVHLGTNGSDIVANNLSDALFGNRLTSTVISGNYSVYASSPTNTFTVNVPKRNNNTYQAIVTPTNAVTGGSLFYITNKTARSFDVVFTSSFNETTVAFDWMIKP